MYIKKFTLPILLTLIPVLSIAQIKTVNETPAGISARLQYEIDMTKDPALGYVPSDRLPKAYQLRKDLINKKKLYKANLTWVERGPYSDAVGSSNGNTRPGNGKTSGRMRAIWEDLSDTTGKLVWVGGIDGGLWKTTNILANPAGWTPINDYFGNLSVSSICQDPTNYDIMYFGTGEKAINADAVRGAGIWASSDHGANWSVMSGTTGFWNVSKVICDASGNLYVACNSTSNNAGIQRYNKSTGTWTNITPSGLAARIPDMELSSTGRLHITCGYYNTSASSSGYRYTDNPSTVSSTTWTSPSTTFTTQYNVDIATCGNTLYALPSNSAWNVTAIYKSTDGGANWSATTSTPSFTSGQSWYNMAVAIDPDNANNVLVGALDCYLSTNGGGSWTKVSNWVGTTGQYVHADQQIMTWRSNNRILVGSDGGISVSTDGGSTFSDRNVGLRIKQFYSIAIHPTSTNYFLAGAQDNGVHQLNGAGLTTSIEVTGGDWEFVNIDQNQGAYQWGSYVYNQYRRSTNSGSSWSSVNYSSSAGRFINPTDYDDANNIMYCSGAANQFVRWNDPQTGSTFSAISMTGLNSGTVSAVKVSPYTSHTVYFAGGGSGVTPSLIKATSANATPSFTSIIGSGMTTSSANISCIEFGTSEQNIIVVYSNYGINNVWVTSNGGTNWTAIDGNLPDMPVRWAMFYPGNNNKVLLATETGIWQTNAINGSSTVWDPETSFPNVRTDMLEYRSSDSTVAAGTHGRGIFSAKLTASSACGNMTGLNSSTITDSTATILWASLSGALTYDVDYKANSASSWTNILTATSSLSVGLTNLSPGTLYDYRVRANCSAGIGAYTQAQFTTTAPPSCNASSGLASSSITNNSASISWTAVSSAISYDVDYKLSTASSWSNAASATTSTSVNLSGLSSSTLYEYRVRTNCSSLSSSYSQAQFTTSAPPSCSAPSALSASSITSSSATISWAAVSGANSYDVDYKLNSASSWTNAATGTTSNSVSISSLTASSLYDWQVRTNCASLSSSYSQAQFTTASASSCPGSYDVSTNGTSSGAATIPSNTDIYGLINPKGEVDYYKFVINTGGTATLTLSNLPADYDLKLYSSNGTSQLATSSNGGTTAESISRTYTAGTYFARVNGYKSAYNASKCYTLKLQLGTATGQLLDGDVTGDQGNLQVSLIPNPVTDKLTIYIIGDNTQKQMSIYDINGKEIFKQPINEMFTTLDLEKLNKGMYFVHIIGSNGKLLRTERFIKN